MVASRPAGHPFNREAQDFHNGWVFEHIDSPDDDDYCEACGKALATDGYCDDCDADYDSDFDAEA